MKSGNLNFLEPSGPLQACNGTALPLPIHNSRIRNYALHDMTLLQMSFSRFVGTGSSCITYSNGRTKHISRQLRKFLIIFNKNYSFN